MIHNTVEIGKNNSISLGVVIRVYSAILNNCEIGDLCKLRRNVIVHDNVKLGRNVKVQNNVSIYSGVECEDDVFIGPSAVFTNILNPRSAVDKSNKYIKTLLKKGVTIGANATILCGNVIGRFSMVGAGSVVTKDVKVYELVVGNPAVRIGFVSEYGNVLSFNYRGIAVCPESGQRYVLRDNKCSRYEKDN